MGSELENGRTMSGKSVTLSARISQEDADFLASLQPPGAVTPSDKLRHLLSEARRWQEDAATYESSLARYAELAAPALRRWRQAERAEHMHSEVVRLLAEWLPETMAFMASAVPGPDDPTPRPELEALEAGLADRAFTFVDTLLRLGVTATAPGYDPEVVARRIEPVFDLLSVMQAARRAR